MAVELVGIETCYRRGEEIPARFKPCPCAAAVQITAPFCEPAIASRSRFLRRSPSRKIHPEHGSVFAIIYVAVFFFFFEADFDCLIIKIIRRDR